MATLATWLRYNASKLRHNASTLHYTASRLRMRLETAPPATHTCTPPCSTISTALGRSAATWALAGQVGVEIARRTGCIRDMHKGYASGICMRDMHKGHA